MLTASLPAAAAETLATLSLVHVSAMLARLEWTAQRVSILLRARAATVRHAHACYNARMISPTDTAD